MAVVGSGDLDHPITPRSGDEIGDLARSFQQMTGNLRQSRAELVHVNAELAAKIGQLEAAQAQLVEQEKLASVGQMAAGVAHGLRNPLASLRASAQLALRHPDSPAARESLESMISEVDRLDKRITHLLTFSRPAPLHPMRESLSALVAGLLPALNRLLQDRAVTLRTDLPGDLPDTMLDPMKVEQTMHELIANALDAMPGGGTLGLSARASDDRTSVIVEITDTGKGIPDEVLPAVTDPFFTTRPEGTGLGLAIAKRFVEQNGGTLEISSAVGSRHDGGDPLPRRAHDGRQRMSSGTILVVDDERTLARAIRGYLVEAGYEVEVAGDAEQALEMLDRLRPDVVFTDVRLPGMSGIDLLRKIREFDAGHLRLRHDRASAPSRGRWRR